MTKDNILIIFNEPKEKIVVEFKDPYEQEIKQNEVVKVDFNGKTGVALSLDKKTGVLHLLDKNGEVMSSVDFPTEKIITNAYYDDNTKELVIEFENANAVRIPIDFTDEIESAISVFESKINQQLEQYQSNTNQKIDNLEKEINENVNKNLETLNSKIDNLEEEINTNVNLQVENLNTKVDNLENTINNNIGKQVENLNQNINSLDTRLATNETNANANAIAIETLTKENQTQNSNIIKAQQTAEESKTIALGRTRSKVFDNFSTLMNYLKNASSTEFNVGDNLYIKATNVPDYWISNILNNNNGTYGYYEISQLEMQKVDLTDYQKKNLTTTINISGVEESTVEGAIDELNTQKENKANLLITTEIGTSQTLGGIPKGTILKGQSVTSVLEQLLFPYIAFSMNVQSVRPTGTYEKGTSVTITSVTVRITAGTKAVTNIKLYESNKTTLLGEKTSGIVTDNTFSINKTVTSSVSFYATATDGKSNLSDSSSFLAFYDPTFYGVLDTNYTLSSDLITNKSKDLKSNKSNTRTYNATNQHPFLAYPSSYGALSSIKDGNGFECIGDFNASTINLTVKSGTVAYRVYVLKSATTGTGYKYIFS